MSVRIRCPKCRGVFEAAETDSAGVIECPSCHQQMKWPPASSKPTAPAPPKPTAAAPPKLPAASVAEVAAAVKQASRLPAPHPPRPASPARRMSPGLVIGIIAGGIVVVGLVGGGVYMAVSGGLSTPPPKPVETASQVPPKVEKPTPKPGTEAPVKPTPVPAPVPVSRTSPVDLDPSALFARASPAVVCIEVMNAEYEKRGQGSGFLVSPDGLIVTNHHVMRAGRRGLVRFGDGKAYPVTAVIAQDSKKDLAVLKINVTDLPYLDLLPKEVTPQVGTRAFAIGTPVGYTNTLSEGLVSGLREMNERAVVQTSAPISSGSSGGPLLDARARVVGVNTFVHVEHSGAQVVENINFAVSSKEVHEILAKAMAAKAKFAATSRGKPLDAESAADVTRAYGLVAKGQWLDAASLAKSLAGRNPENVECLLLEALVDMRVNILDGAIKSYEAVIRVDPDEPQAHLGLGLAYLKKSLWKEAADALARAVKCKPEDSSAQQALGVALMHLDRKDEALAALKEAARLDEDDPGSWMGLGEAYMAQKLYPPAEDAFRRSLRLNPNNPLGHALLGMAAYHNGHFDEAIGSANTALRMQPNMPYAQLVLGLALARTGHADQAKQILDTLEKAAPDLAKQLSEAMKAGGGTGGDKKEEPAGKEKPRSGGPNEKEPPPK